MTLASSGTMSIGGTTTDRSINLEIKRSATATSSMGETSLRDLAEVSSGAISMSNFYGKSYYDWSPTVTIGSFTYFGQSFVGYAPNIGGNQVGSTNDTSCDLYSTTPTWGFYHVNNGNANFYVYDTAGTPTGNAGWSNVDVYVGQQDTSGTSYTTIARTSASYSTQTGLRYWDLGSTLFSVSSVWVTLGFR